MSAAPALILPKVTFAPSLRNKYHKVQLPKLGPALAKASKNWQLSSPITEQYTTSEGTKRQISSPLKAMSKTKSLDVSTQFKELIDTCGPTTQRFKVSTKKSPLNMTFKGQPQSQDLHVQNSDLHVSGSNKPHSSALRTSPRLLLKWLHSKKTPKTFFEVPHKWPPPQTILVTFFKVHQKWSHLRLRHFH